MQTWITIYGWKWRWVNPRVIPATSHVALELVEIDASGSVNKIYLSFWPKGSVWNPWPQSSEFNPGYEPDTTTRDDDKKRRFADTVVMAIDRGKPVPNKETSLDKYPILHADWIYRSATLDSNVGTAVRRYIKEQKHGTGKYHAVFRNCASLVAKCLMQCGMVAQVSSWQTLTPDRIQSLCEKLVDTGEWIRVK